MEAALKAYGKMVEHRVDGYLSDIRCPKRRAELEESLRGELAVKTEFTPYKFHVSEDIYTSIILHSDAGRNWKSVLHPEVESKMLSPLDMKSWTMQRFKYAGGTIDIMWNDNPLFRPGLSLQQKLMYAMTFWSYLAPLWAMVFIGAPIFALATGIAPVAAYSSAFFAHLLPFLIMHELATVVGTWGLDNRKGRMLNLAFFSFNLQALWAVLCRREIKFKVTPKKRQEDSFLFLVTPQISVVVLTILALGIAIHRQTAEPDPTQLGALIVNGFWAVTNAYAMTVLIYAALWRPEKHSLTGIDVKNRKRFRRVS